MTYLKIFTFGAVIMGGIANLSAGGEMSIKFNCTASKCGTVEGMKKCVKSGEASISVLGEILPENPNCVRSFLQNVCNKKGFCETQEQTFVTYDKTKSWTPKEMCQAAADSLKIDLQEIAPECASVPEALKEIKEDELAAAISRGHHAQHRHHHAG